MTERASLVRRLSLRRSTRKPASAGSDSGAAPTQKTSKVLDSPPENSLQSVVGTTSLHNSAFAVSPGEDSNTFAYVAGTVIVLRNALSSAAERYIVNQTRKAFSCIAFSPDASLLAAGEVGHRPAVCVYATSSGKLLQRLVEHEYGISCVAFSPDGRWIASAGFHNDQRVIVWDWKNDHQLAGNRAASKLFAMSWDSKSGTFVTSGLRHLRFWDAGGSASSVRKGEAAAALKNRAATSQEGLDLVESVIIDCVCGTAGMQSVVYCVTSDASIHVLGVQQRSVLRSTATGGERAYAIDVRNGLVACALNAGRAACFDAATLRKVGDYASAPELGHGADSWNSGSDRRPDTVALRLLGNGDAVALYSDRSIAVLSNPQQGSSTRWRREAHAACVWDSALSGRCCSRSDADPRAGSGNSIASRVALAEQVSLFTAAADGTVREWHFCPSDDPNNRLKGDMVHARALHTDEAGLDAATADGWNLRAEPRAMELAHETLALPAGGNRSLALAPGGAHMAVGATNGTVRVFTTRGFEPVAEIEAHASEVLSLSFSAPQEDANGRVLLATGGRDRLTHVLDATDHYAHVRTLADHSSGVTAVSFTAGGTVMISASADKSLLFRRVGVAKQTGRTILKRIRRRLVPYGTIFDVAVDQSGARLAVAAQDRAVHLFDAITGEESAALRPQATDTREAIRVAWAPSGTFLAAAYADRSVHLFNVEAASHVACLAVHARLVTCVRFLSDEDLVTCTADGCLFCWRSPKSSVAQAPLASGDRLASSAAPVAVSKGVAQPSTARGPQETDRGDIHLSLSGPITVPGTLPPLAASTLPDGNQKPGSDPSIGSSDVHEDTGQAAQQPVPEDGGRKADLAAATTPEGNTLPTPRHLRIVAELSGDAQAVRGGEPPGRASLRSALGDSGATVVVRDADVLSDTSASDSEAAESSGVAAAMAARRPRRKRKQWSHQRRRSLTQEEITVQANEMSRWLENVGEAGYTIFSDAPDDANHVCLRRTRDGVTWSRVVVIDGETAENNASSASGDSPAANDNVALDADAYTMGDSAAYEQSLGAAHRKSRPGWGPAGESKLESSRSCDEQRPREPVLPDLDAEETASASTSNERIFDETNQGMPPRGASTDVGVGGPRADHHATTVEKAQEPRVPREDLAEQGSVPSLRATDSTRAESAASKTSTGRSCDDATSDAVRTPGYGDAPAQERGDIAYLTSAVSSLRARVRKLASEKASLSRQLREARDALGSARQEASALRARVRELESSAAAPNADRAPMLRADDMLSISGTPAGTGGLSKGRIAELREHRGGGVESRHSVSSELLRGGDSPRTTALEAALAGVLPSPASTTSSGVEGGEESAEDDHGDADVSDDGAGSSGSENGHVGAGAEDLSLTGRRSTKAKKHRRRRSLRLWRFDNQSELWKSSEVEPATAPESSASEGRQGSKKNEK